MPIYEYYCPDCQNAFEVMRPMHESNQSAICPECQGAHAQRTLSLFAAVSVGGSKASSAEASHTMLGGGGGCCGGACGCGHVH